MSKILYTCASCSAHLQDKPETKTSFNSHPHNVCPCGTVLDSPSKYRAEMVTDDYWYSLPKIRLHPNWLN